MLVFDPERFFEYCVYNFEVSCIKSIKKLIKALRLTLINTEGYPRLKKGNLDL